MIRFPTRKAPQGREPEISAGAATSETWRGWIRFGEFRNGSAGPAQECRPAPDGCRGSADVGRSQTAKPCTQGLHRLETAIPAGLADAAEPGASGAQAKTDVDGPEA